MVFSSFSGDSATEATKIESAPWKKLTQVSGVVSGGAIHNYKIYLFILTNSASRAVLARIRGKAPSFTDALTVRCS